MSTEREQDLVAHVKAEAAARRGPDEINDLDFLAGHDAATARAKERIAELDAELDAKHAKLVETADKLRIERTCNRIDDEYRAAFDQLKARAESAEAALEAERAKVVELSEQLERLKSDASWKDRAVDERVKRVAAEARESALRERIAITQKAPCNRPDRFGHPCSCCDATLELLDPTRQQRIDKLQLEIELQCEKCVEPAVDRTGLCQQHAIDAIGKLEIEREEE